MAEADNGSDKTTEIMAQLLLKGWAMLSDVCAECQQVPLMRSRQGELRCCRCNKVGANNISKPNVVDKIEICNINSYKPYAEIPLNGKDSVDLHESDVNVGKLSNNLIKNTTTMSSCTFDFQSKQLNLLEIQINKCLQKYITMLSESVENEGEDIDRDAKILKIIESLLNNITILKRIS